MIELVALNDSLQKENVEARKNLEQQLQTRTQQYLNTELKSDQEHEKFIIADTAYKEEMLKKNIYQGTTIVAIIAFLVALFI